MTGENLAHAGKNAVAGCARRTDGQKLQQAVFIDGGCDIRVAEERFWLGAKDQRAARGTVEERLGAGTVTVQKQFAGSAVPDHKGKNAVQTSDKIPPIVQIGAENDFRVGSGGKSIPGGEKRRLFLLGILASAPNVLLLDEPTNDLDIPTMTVLENYLQSFPGAIIAVSHDRYFLDKLCNRIFAVEKSGQVRQYPGGYTDYLQSLDIPREKKVKAAPEAPRPKSKKLKFSYKEQREFETIDADIADLESKIAENKRQQDIDGADYEKLQALMAEQSQLESQLEAKEERWMYLTDLAERIAKGEYSEI